jgi:hypothetical protein
VSDPDFDPKFNQLINLTAATSLDISAEAGTAARRPVFSPESRRALVARAPAIFGMGRARVSHDEFSEVRSQVHISYGRDEALSWLGLKPFPR